MADDFAELDSWLTGIIKQLSAKERRSLAGEIAKGLRKSNQQRIAAQVSPGGTAFAPRLRQNKGKIRRAMFGKLRQNRWMKATGAADEATVEFIGRAAQMARVHHFGLRDRVNKRGLEVKFTARPLLGISDSDVGMIEQLVMDHISK